MDFAGRGILLDIEGTTSSISFVYDVMFPFARRELEAYLRSHWTSDELRAACEFIARDAGHDTFDDWRGESQDAERDFALVRDEVVRQMDTDAKATGLKQLQGLIWRAGFESGELRSHVYDDVPPALQAWKAAGKDVRIYSSGSITAQKMFFANTVHGDLLPLVAGHYDTTTGPKRESESYRIIAAAYDLPPAEILFISDVTAELDAAAAAGMPTCLSIRPGNPESPAGHGHDLITDFSQVMLVRRER